MSVYVDPLFEWTGPYRGKDAGQAQAVGAKNGHRWCHMFSDDPTAADLHQLAQAIGLRRAWFQADHDGGHYDLTPGRRAKAIAAGAIPVDRHEAVRIWREVAEKLAKQPPVFTW